MSDVQEAGDWWVADDGRWYPPDRHPDYRAPTKPPEAPTSGGRPSTPPSATQAAEAPVPVLTPETNGMAIAALVMSILGYILIGFGTFFGIVFGWLALGQLRRSDPPERGRGLAVAALILSLLQVALAVLIVTVLVVVVAAVAVRDEVDLQLMCRGERLAMRAAADEYREDRGEFPSSMSQVEPYLDSPIYHFKFSDKEPGRLYLEGDVCEGKGGKVITTVVTLGTTAIVTSLGLGFFLWRRRRRRSL